MGLFSKLFGKSKNGQQNFSSSENEIEHAVIVRFEYQKEELDDLFGLCDKLEKILTDQNVGEFDGHELAIGGNDCFLYMYGSNAEVLFKTIKPILESIDFMKGGIARLRFGPPEEGVKEIEIEI